MVIQSARGKGKRAHQNSRVLDLVIHRIKKDKFLQKMYMNGDPCSMVLLYNSFNPCKTPK